MDNKNSLEQRHTSDPEVDNLNHNGEEEEIDLLELAGKLWDRRKTIIRWGLVGVVIGLIVAFSIPREYTASVTLAPEMGNAKGGSGSLGALASFAGINMGQGSSADAVYPELYPDVVSSTPFSVDLLDVNVETEIEDFPKGSIKDILDEHTSAPWWGVIMGLPGKIIGGIKGLFTSEEVSDPNAKMDPFHLTVEQSSLVEALKQRVGATVDTKTSVVTISATMQDPLAAAQLADSVTERLKDYVTNYRTSKSRKDLEYARKINEEARQEYYSAQKRYANAADRNHGLATRAAAIDLERLQNEAQLAFGIYNNTAQQVKLAEAKVQETTPVFAVIKPASVPVKPSKPSKVLILIGFTFLAVVASCAYILFVPQLIEGFKNRKKAEPTVD